MASPGRESEFRVVKELPKWLPKAVFCMRQTDREL